MSFDQITDIFDDYISDRDSTERFMERIEALPRTKHTMVRLYQELRHISSIEGWIYLWNESEFVVGDYFRLLIANQICAVSKDNIDALFPDMREWVQDALAEQHLNLKDVITRDYLNDELKTALSIYDADIDQLGSIIALGMDLPPGDSDLFALRWSKAEIVGAEMVVVDSAVDFIAKETLPLFTPIPAFDRLELEDIAKLDYETVLLHQLQPVTVEPYLFNPNSPVIPKMLRAEVPAVVDKEAGSVGAAFLQTFLERVVKAGDDAIFDSSAELTDFQGERTYHNVLLYNKLSFYKEVKRIYDALEA